MWVDAIVRINISTALVDRTGSIVAAVADALDITESEATDLDNWVWQYDSNAEIDWANSLGRNPLTGEAWAEEEDAS